MIHWIGERKTESGHIVLVYGRGDHRTEIPTPFRSGISREVLGQIIRDNADEIVGRTNP